MADLGVAHLVRERNGIKPFRDFLSSYNQHRDRTPHDLLIIYKGFANAQAAQPYRDELGAIPHQEFFVKDIGFDLRSYGLAARHFEHKYLCFLNSHSEILDDQWLAKMSTLIERPGVGLVGATGSYESFYSSLLWSPAPPKFTMAALIRAFRLRVNRHCFYPFPNPHIRTNAFLISRLLMLQVWTTAIHTKAAAYLLENGRNSFTQRVMRKNLKVLVASRDGVGYEKEDWWRSNTFRQSNQENLLIADNRTKHYSKADFELRKALSKISWNDRANPTPPLSKHA